MSQAVAGKAMAGYGGMLGQPVFSRTDPRYGRPWMFMDNSHGGTGARANQDGVDCVSWPWNAANHMIEVLETQAPVRIERFELAPDSEGAGTWRGGLGVIKDYRILDGPVNVQVGGDRFKAPATGLAGGGTSVPQTYILTHAGVEAPVKSKSGPDAPGRGPVQCADARWRRVWPALEPRPATRPTGRPLGIRESGAGPQRVRRHHRRSRRGKPAGDRRRTRRLGGVAACLR